MKLKMGPVKKDPSLSALGANAIVVPIPRGDRIIAT